MSIWKVPPQTADPDLRPALFLDRDGVVIADADYLSDPQQIEILPGVKEALALARQAGFLLIGVSNQSGIGRGFFSQEDFEKVMTCLDAELALAGAQFDSFHFCPHQPADACSCRKPRQGMFREAMSLHNINLASSWMIGDKASDLDFGIKAGLKSILVETGYGQKERAKLEQNLLDSGQVLVFDDLPTAIKGILLSDRDLDS